MFKVYMLTLRALLLPRPSEPWLVARIWFVGTKKAGVLFADKSHVACIFLNAAKVGRFSELARKNFRRGRKWLVLRMKNFRVAGGEAPQKGVQRVFRCEN